MSPPRQLGLLWGGVALLLLGLAPIGGRLAGALPACPFRTLIGLPCMSCGTTRAALALAALEPLAALRLNPLATLGWAGLVGGGLVAGSRAVLGRPIAAPRWNVSLKTRLTLVSVGLGNWAYLIWSNV